LRGVGKHRPNANSNDPRHLLSFLGDAENELKNYLANQRIPPDYAELIYIVILVFRYNSWLKSRIYKVSTDTDKYWKHQWQRILFAATSQSINRIQLLSCLLTRAKSN